MRSRMLLLSLLTAFLVAGPALVGKRATASDKASPGTMAQAPETTLSDQVDLAVTVYNSNLALVREVRQVRLPAGVFDLRFADIAATINPASVHLRSLTDPARLSVIEQNHEYDLLDPQKLLQKYVGREITLVRLRQDNGSTKSEEVRALLLAYNNSPVWKIGNEIVTGMAADHFRFPELPENLYSRPTLVWTLENSGSRQQKVEASYLAGNMAWNADYVLTVNREDASADLDGWVTLVNNSGTTYQNAKLQLVAGDLSRVMQQYPGDAVEARRALEAMAAPQPFAREAFSEYHLYTLNRRTSIRDRESKQISLLTASRVPVEKVFVVKGQQTYYHNYLHPGSPIKDRVAVYYKFQNDERSGLGVPLPAGVVRVYQSDASGGVHFVGEDRITHTPKGESLTLRIGHAFDVVCERKQTDYRKLSDRLYEMEFEITLRNHKDSAITVEVNEPIGSDWQMIDSTHKWTKTAAWAAQFRVPVEKSGTAVLRYRVRVRW